MHSFFELITCPAVSHICNFILLSPICIIRVPNSIPIVFTELFLTNIL